MDAELPSIMLRRGFLRRFILALATLCFAWPACAASDGAAELRRFDAALAQANANDDAFLAPRHLAEAGRLYQLATVELKAQHDGQAAAYAEQGLKAVIAAQAAAQEVGRTLADALATRRFALQLHPSIASRAAAAEQLMREAAAAAEAGDQQDARQTAQRSADAFAAAAASYFRDVRLPEIQAEWTSLQGKLLPADSERARTEIARVRASLDRLSAARLAQAAADVGAIIQILYPPFFLKPPSRLQMDGFVLQVVSYDSKGWDFKNNVIVGASGTAWVTFQCTPLWPWWFGVIATVEKNFLVVDAVKNAAAEISIADAQKIDANAVLGGSLKLNVPQYAKTADQLAVAVGDILKWPIRPVGAITVHFDNLTIKPGGTPDTEIVLAGTAAYPTNPPDPQTATLTISGFTLYLQSLTLTPTGATAKAVLEMPASIVDPGTGHPGRVDLGGIAITPACVFRSELPAAPYGPWAVGNTEMQVQGVGVTADFDPAWASPSAPAGSPAVTPSWIGVLLGGGNTIGTPSGVVSNSGYLRAKYTYPNALVTGSGLTGQFTLAAPYEFASLEPYGYRVRISTGNVQLADSAVAGGSFDQDDMLLPERAVRDPAGAPVKARHAQLGLTATLDLQGLASVLSPIRWGEFTQHSPSAWFFEASDSNFGRFYLSGTIRSNFFPLDAADQFVEPNGIIQPLPVSGMQGMTLFFPQTLVVRTPDTPGQTPLVFKSTNKEDRLKADWLNVSYGGVHGRMQNYLSDRSSKTDLGPTYASSYVGELPFVAGVASGSKDMTPTPYTLTIRFVSSAVYDADMKGALHIPLPVNSELDFDLMAFTSLAQISGAKVPFTNPLKLSYWGLDMVKKPGAAAGGIISVRTGQVFFTAAGISEARHFAMPFYLTWGELLANGQLRRLVFDYNAAGQKFDQFRYVTTFVKLSDFDASQPTLPAYLKTAGNASLDFFGAKYINLNDTYDPSKTGDPYDSRVVALMDDSDPGNAFQGTDHNIAADWSSGFGTLKFTYDYDAAAQDGFIGTGTMGLQWIDQALASTIVIKPGRACMSANDTNRHDFTLGPVARFGTMSRITGCGCIVANQLERVLLSAELEANADVNIFVGASTYADVEWILTPGVSSVALQGDMFASLLGTGNIGVNGAAKFVVNRDQNFVEGDVDGTFDTSTALGLASLSASGHVNWHIGTLGSGAYEAIQGQLALSVATPLAGGSAEGGFYFGVNAPKAEAWVLAAGGTRYGLNTTALPDNLTGVFGYVRFDASLNLYIVSGGYEQFVGLGGFSLTAAQAANLGAQSPASPANVVGLPYVIGDVGAHVWGSILGGLVSADGWADLQVIVPYPFSFQGTVGLEGCALWVACSSVDVTVGLNSSQGFYLE